MLWIARHSVGKRLVVWLAKRISPSDPGPVQIPEDHCKHRHLESAILASLLSWDQIVLICVH